MKYLCRFVFIIFAGVGLGFAQSTQLSLEDCIAIALKNNTTLVTGRNSNKSSKEDVLASYSGILPLINMSASQGTYEAGPATDMRDVQVGVDTTTVPPAAIIERRMVTQDPFKVNSNDLGMRISQNIFDGGEWWNAIRYAKSQKKAADLNLQSVTNTVVLNVQERYFDLLRQLKLLEVNELAVKRSQDQLDKTQKMFELGAVAKVDVFRSKVNLGNDKITYLSQKNAVITAKNNLNLVMGRQPSDTLDIIWEFSLKPNYENVDQLIIQALESNPDIKTYNQDIRSKELQVARSIAPVYPRIGASFSYNRSNEDKTLVYSEFDKNWSYSYGFSISLNLFNGFRDKTNIQKSKLMLKNSIENYENAKRNITAAISQYADNYDSYLEIIKIDEENLEASKEEYRLAEERYRIGSGTQLEVREAQVNLTRAEQTLVAAKYFARVTQAQIEQALGTIYAIAQENN
jgi:outer membrane protein